MDDGVYNIRTTTQYSLVENVFILTVLLTRQREKNWLRPVEILILMSSSNISTINTRRILYLPFKENISQQYQVK